MNQVFISHSSKDDAFVTGLAADLREADVKTWVDHDDILPGTNWDRAVETALRDCEVMLVILSPHSVDSDNVTDEWSYFIDEGKPIYPILVQVCDVPFRLRRRQRVDFTEDQPGALDELLVVLERVRKVGIIA